MIAQFALSSHAAAPNWYASLPQPKKMGGMRVKKSEVQGEITIEYDYDQQINIVNCFVKCDGHEMEIDEPLSKAELATYEKLCARIVKRIESMEFEPDEPQELGKRPHLFQYLMLPPPGEITRQAAEALRAIDEARMSALPTVEKL